MDVFNVIMTVRICVKVVLRESVYLVKLVIKSTKMENVNQNVEMDI